MLSLKDFRVIIVHVVLLIVHSSNGSEIIGGKEVKPHSLPFMALLENSDPFCGGVLIHPKWVLSAAHCSKVQKVLLGVHSIKTKDKEFRQILKVKERVPHPCYDEKDKVNDLMLLKLQKSAKMTKAVNCLKLSKIIKEPTAGISCMVAGWGQTNNMVRKMSDVLMSVNVTVIDRAKCNSQEYYNLKPVITSSMICAGADGSNPADTCLGDSGGPLLCDGVLVGITSFGGRKCGVMKKPGVYSFLSEKHLSWITKTIKSSEFI